MIVACGGREVNSRTQGSPVYPPSSPCRNDPLNTRSAGVLSSEDTPAHKYKAAIIRTLVRNGRERGSVCEDPSPLSSCAPELPEICVGEAPARFEQFGRSFGERGRAARVQGEALLSGCGPRGFSSILEAAKSGRSSLQVEADLRTLRMLKQKGIDFRKSGPSFAPCNLETPSALNFHLPKASSHLNPRIARPTRPPPPRRASKASSSAASPKKAAPSPSSESLAA